MTGAEFKDKRTRVNQALEMCKSSVTACEDCPEWNGEACGMAAETLEIMAADRELIDFLRKQWATYWADAAEKTAFEPARTRLKIAAAVREKLAEYGL